MATDYKDKQCERFWEDFILEHGPASQTHTAFLGYLYQHNVQPYADVVPLRAAYAAFVAFMAAE